MLINKKGFTFIELLIIIGIIAILAGIVLVAINPAQQISKKNDSERKSEIGTVLSAIYKYQTSTATHGALPECLLGTTPVATAIPECDNPTGPGGVFDGAVELGAPSDADSYDCSTTLTPSYLREIPIDPTSTYNTTATGYYVCQDTTGASAMIYVISVGAEVFTDDGGCEHPDGTGAPAMCVSRKLTD